VDAEAAEAAEADAEAAEAAEADAGVAVDAAPTASAEQAVTVVNTLITRRIADMVSRLPGQPDQ
jgi:hypothetical protein